MTFNIKKTDASSPRKEVLTIARKKDYSVQRIRANQRRLYDNEIRLLKQDLAKKQEEINFIKTKIRDKRKRIKVKPYEQHVIDSYTLGIESGFTVKLTPNQKKILERHGIR